MKILVVSSQPPSPYSGGETRLFNLIKPLAEKHEITVVSLVQKISEPVLAEARRYCNFISVPLPNGKPVQSRLYYIATAWRQALFESKPRLAAEIYFKSVQERIDQILKQEKYDIIQAQQLMMAQYIPADIDSPTVVDVDNLWSKLIPRTQALVVEEKLTRRIQTRLDMAKVSQYETRILNRFTASLAISREEKEIIKNLAPQSKVEVVPNGVDTDYFRPQRMGANGQETLLFVGTMAWLPNIEAVGSFAAQIFPAVQKYFPNARFQIVGRDPSPEVLALRSNPNIEVTGFVDDVRPYLASSQVFVVPLRAGAGTRLKILEAMAMGKAIVSTSIGAEGINVTNGKDILLADDPVEFAQKVIELLNSPALREKLGANGRKLVEKEFGWTQIASRLDHLYSVIS